MKVGFLIRDFQVFETEVQMITDLIGRKVKIRVRISSGKYPHRIDFLLSDIAPDFKESKNQRGTKVKECGEKATLKSGLKRKNNLSFFSFFFFNIVFVHNIYLYSLFFFSFFF